jgi:hypothetical protein
MTRFYFHFREHGRLVLDEQGSEHPDLAAAHREAVLTARELLSEAIRFGVDEVPDALVIGDRCGRSVALIEMGSVLPKRMR